MDILSEKFLFMLNLSLLLQRRNFTFIQHSKYLRLTAVSSHSFEVEFRIRICSFLKNPISDNI